MVNFFDKLNPEQKAAVSLPAESAMILAGAGSGKTRVLTTRIAYLLQSNMASPYELLAVTFTNKAAKEMLTRITSSIPINTRGMWIGTFHGLCNRLLRKHYREVGLPQTFQILDQSDQLSAIKRVMKVHGISDELFPPKKVQNYIGAAKEEGLRAKDMMGEFGDRAQYAKIYELYEQQCNREGVADFGELLLRSYELLARNALIRRHYQERFKFILVDEFQDTNRLQYKWLKLLGGFDPNGHREYEGNCVFAVGDDDQSIYAFRGANVGNMTDFQRDFRIRHLIKLEQNYRSFGHILNAANELIAHNAERLGKNLWTSQGEGEYIRVFRAVDDRQEAAYLVQEIQEAIRNGTPKQEIAILYRSNAQSRVIEQALVAAGIAYRVYGGLRFFDRAEIKHALAYMRLIENPKDDTAFLRVVNFPMRGIGAKSMEMLQAKSAEMGISLYESVNYMEGAAGAKLKVFTDLVDTMRFEFSCLPLPEMIASVVERSGLLAHYKKDKDGGERLENLEELESAARAYLIEEGIGVDSRADYLEEDAQDDEMTALAGFLSHAALEAGENQAENGQEAVQLMTVHASKGLEFNVVFNSGLEEGLFPHANSANDTKGLEEERRLMYVAITRARKLLHLSFAQTRMLHGQMFESGQSMFLNEIPEEHLCFLYDRKKSWLAEDEDQSAWWDSPRTSRSSSRSSDFTGDYSGTSRWGDRGGYGSSYGSGYGSSGGSRSYGNGYSRTGSSYGSKSGTKSYGSGYGNAVVSGPRKNFMQAKLDPAFKKIAKTQEVGGFSIGNRVSHPKFGNGEVIALVGMGNDARIRIKFDGVGTKELMLSLAKLTKL